MSTWLCIGNGESLVQYEDYIVYNNYDYKIGTKFQLENTAWNLDWTAAADGYAVEELLKKHPDWQDKIISRNVGALRHNVLSTKLKGKSDVTGTLQLRWAIEHGATHITTIAFDSLANNWNKHTTWEWSLRQIDRHIMKPWDLDRKRNKLLNTWREQTLTLQQEYPSIHWEHKHIGNISE